ncbi:mandelate racemase/muconate lactonizing enzyme family protein [Acinetobacter pragensis]|uniref:Mandelate racemase n=1 Tax=Acinetobacter pragensis TaxID=1806892 RepID=A0A151Y2T8_9GAMM|nr:mandelate racemase/muconate lactonizing enzyme family protein [Acinetobacter pragensis]KYQ72362.1 mandelate racemase [Acinetobacter pragensis]
MEITRIEIIRIAIPFTAGRNEAENSGQDFNAASPNLNKMESLIVKIHTDNGRIGWGEAFGHLVNAVCYAALEKFVAPFFLNKQIETQHDLAALMKSAEYAFHGFGRTGPIRYALSAIDIALWDLISQHAGLPLWKMLGAERQKISIYPSLVSYGNDPDLVHKKVKEVVDLGFKQIKLHETTFEAVAAAKNALNENCSLMVDVNCCWNKEDAAAEIAKLKTLNLKWLEEPVWPVDDFDALQELNQQGISISAGENTAGELDAIHLIKNKIVDIVQPSVAKIGGVSSAVQVINAGSEHSVTVVPHCFYYGPGMLATAHLVALLPDDIYLEVPYIQFKEHLHVLTQYQPEIILPETPGLGFQINEDILKKYTVVSSTCMNQGV